jgi:arylsulfatase A-like enzyme/predicted Zn-dependent protease
VTTVFRPSGVASAATRRAPRLLLLALLPLLLTCKRAQERPPVILISIDTLRADRLPMYGYRGVETPALDALRRDSVLFRNAWSHSPLTLPSHATMLTGLLPANHGIRDNTGFRLGGDVPTVATMLRSNGYATGAAVSAFVLRTATGVNSGFDAYDDRLANTRTEKSLGHIQRAGAETIAAAQNWISSRGDEPFFYFLHLYEPHAPYEAPEPFASRYASSPYDGEVAHADAIVGEFLSFLRERGIYDRALILLVSDHGEGLGDHGEDEHGIFLYREAISVPMLVKLPNGALAGESTDNPAGLFDVAPTILAQTHVAPAKPMNGTALFDGDRLAKLSARPMYAETWYPRFHFGWSELHSLVAGREHFIDAPKQELYDLAADPHERVNVFNERRRSVVAMRQSIAQWKKEAAAPAAVSAEEIEKLAALGYIGSASAKNDDGPRHDPKDKIATFRELQNAFGLSRAGRNEEAVAAFDRLLAKEPQMVDLWDVRSKALLRLGRTSEGIESAKQALRLNPSATHIAADLANALLLDGQLEDAQKHAELALRNDPAKANAILARVHLARNDLAGAENAVRAALAADSKSDAARYTLALIQQKRGDFAGVLETTSQLSSRDVRGVAALRGDALARAGRDSEAEAEFRNELAHFPDNTEAARRLVLLLVAQGRNDDATSVIRALADASPNPRTYAAIAETLRIVGDTNGARYWSARSRGAL